MPKSDLKDFIDAVQQPSFDDEMIDMLAQGLNNFSGYYSYIQEQNAISDRKSIDKDSEQELWEKKSPGYNQEDQFRHMGNTGDIGYALTRLYVNCSKSDLMELANLFTDKCISQGLPIYFKYSTSSKIPRADQMVIYSNLKTLSDYIQILQDIGKDNPELIQRFGKPPILTGKINDWIGIGDEPMVSGSSFSSIRTNVISEVLGRIIPHSKDENSEEPYDIQNLDYDYIREELRKAFEELGINIDTFAFNNETLQLYMQDEQSREEYDSTRKQNIKDIKTAKATYKSEQVPIQELKILQQLGIMPESIEAMTKANSPRYGFLMDMVGRNNIGDVLASRFNLPAKVMISDKFEVQVRNAERSI